MTNPPDVPVDALTALIAERTQYEEWIRALDAKRDAVPAHILDRVRSDYKLRLQAVLDRLSAHGDDLRTILTDVDTRLSAAEAQVASRQEARLEAELRAMVGEFTPEKWEAVRVELDDELERLTRERDLLATERASLREIYEQVAPEAGGSAPAVADAEREAVGDSRAADRGASAPISIAVEIDVARGALGARGGESFDAALHDDELADARPETRGSHASSRGESAGLDVPIMDPLGELGFLAPLPDGATDGRQSTPGASPRGIRGSSTTPSGGTSTKRAAAAGDGRPADSAKTLRCQECGAMNYATEWYCERCGGELATL